ncbi:conserved hypothetical protein [Paraburkholderia piptadeniae]|uniref:DUF3579 domain-containing protein n=1 Tax=Paraburkholderia piptadeniae TaxID=1701573 RepID=A0A1N7SK80_9BURK|nr:DUF3579 domain-containing protein [Paraburkholderia piptadeniae]SIT47826.1 conserved hypothetical protein [Paraburkholderia piptadeniae]
MTHYLISGITRARGPFRPNDWAERLAGVVSIFVRERAGASRVCAVGYAMPCVDGDVKCLRVAGALQEICPDALRFVLQFADENDLPVKALDVSRSDVKR